MFVKYSLCATQIRLVNIMTLKIFQVVGSGILAYHDIDKPLPNLVRFINARRSNLGSSTTVNVLMTDINCAFIRSIRSIIFLINTYPCFLVNYIFYSPFSPSSTFPDHYFFSSAKSSVFQRHVT